MLSISNVTAGQASAYYTKSDNYYAKAEGQWTGKGADLLGLSGPVDKAAFENLLNGKDPAGANQLVPAASNGEHRGGVDLTFSAPKSVSLLSDVCGITEVREAHERAVSAALQYAETNIAQCRMTQGGQTERVNTENLLIAKFAHDTSRELDPQLHTHAVVLNVVQDPGSKWKALANENLYQNKMLLGQMYRAELAANLKELGYAVEADSKSFFEIAGVDKSLIDHFSRRSEQIKAAAEKLQKEYPDASESRLREMACLDSRQAKKNVDPSVVREAWAERLEKQGHTKDSILASVREAGEKAKAAEAERTSPKPDEYEYIQMATQALTEQESTFSREDVLKTAARMSVGELRFGELEQAFINFQSRTFKDHQIKLIGKDERGNDVFTTKEMQKIERGILQDARNGQKSVQPILSSEQVKAAVSNKYSHLTDGQKQAVEHILCSADKLTGIQGDAGTGKTTMLSVVKEQLEGQGFFPRGLTFTGKASQELADGPGIKSQTLHHFLGGFDPQKSLNNPDSNKYAEAMKHFSVKDIEAVKQGADLDDIEKAVGAKSLILDTRTSLRRNGGMTITQERYLDAVKRDVQDTLKNTWHKAVAAINPHAVAREKNQTKDVFFRDQDSSVTRGKQVSHWHVMGQGGAERQFYESYTLLQSGEIIHTRHERLAGGKIEAYATEIIKDPGNSVQKGKEVWIVDEASMVGSRQLHQLLDAAQKAEARVVMIGDTKQLQSISAGKMFDKLQTTEAMKTVQMTEAIRQQDPGYKEIVQDIAGKRIAKAFEKLKTHGKIHEIADRESRREAIVNDYTSRKNHENTLIVTARNADRNTLNRAIRERLKEQGKLQGQEHHFVVRESKAIGPTEQHFAQSYTVGDIVVVNGGKTGIKVGAQGRVEAVDRANHTITLNVKGQSRTIDVRQHGASLAAYEEKVQGFVDGDKVVFLKNDKKLGVQNGMTGQVVGLDDRAMTVKTDSGKEITVNPQNYSYIDHGYSVTTHKSQGQTAKDVIFHGESGQEQQSYNSVYVAMSRGKQDISIYTDSASELEQAAMREQVKTSTLDYGKSEPGKIEKEGTEKTQMEGGEIIKNETGKGMESGMKDRADSATPERAAGGETERSHKAESERQRSDNEKSKDIEIER
ncbi:MAG: Multifunctional conjugation protein TraI [Syntrophorhabdaceae bacterium PtaU1.Bin034]|nr:MAG: Multifunctional conjugation protein TraI [Syntrophorhabdaceae bacterium PtaU1.Bin034]